jgi:hypothetical protein
MNNWQVLNRVCFTICIICIVAGAALSLTMIWHKFESDFLMKSWSSMGVLFFASAATLVVSRVVGAKGEAPSHS